MLQQHSKYLKYGTEECNTAFFHGPDFSNKTKQPKNLWHSFVFFIGKSPSCFVLHLGEKKRKKYTQKYQGKGSMKRQVFASDSKTTVKTRSQIFLTTKRVLRPIEDTHELKKTFKKMSFWRYVQTYGFLNSPWTYLGSTTKLVRA